MPPWDVYAPLVGKTTVSPCHTTFLSLSRTTTSVCRCAGGSVAECVLQCAVVQAATFVVLQ
eukprot:3938391-Ditylum_brightwellii.AAC.1